MRLTTALAVYLLSKPASAALFNRPNFLPFFDANRPPPTKRASDCPIAWPTPRANPPNTEPPYPIQISLSPSNSTDSSGSSGTSSQTPSDQSQSSSSQSQQQPPVELAFALPNNATVASSSSASSSSSNSGANARSTSASSSRRTSTTAESSPSSTPDDGVDPEDDSGFDSDDEGSDSDYNTNSTDTDTNTTRVAITVRQDDDGSGSSSSSSSSEGGEGSGEGSGEGLGDAAPCTLFLDLSSPDAKVTGAATVNIYALDGPDTGSLVGTTRFEQGAKATVNSFACRAEEMSFRLEVVPDDSASGSSTEKDGSGQQGVGYLQGNSVGMGLGMRYGC